MRDGVVPEIFDGLPKYVSTPPSVTRSSPTKRRRLVAKRQLQKEEEFHRADTILSFAVLTSLIRLRLTTFTDIVITQDEQQVLLYKLNQEFSVTDCPSVCFSLRIFHDLLVSIWINGIKLKQSELAWLLGHTKGQLTLWSQLSNLLTRYASNIVEPDSCVLLAQWLTWLTRTVVVVTQRCRVQSPLAARTFLEQESLIT